MWHKRLKDLARGGGQPHTPLFAPLLFSVAAQIEAISPDEMASNGTRIRKNVGELRGALGLETVFAMAPNPQVVANLAPIEDSNQASLLATPQVEASVDAVTQWQADSARPIVAIAIDGPQRYIVAAQNHGQLGSTSAEAYYDYVGSSLATMVRQFAEAGIHILFIHDDMPNDSAEIDLWKSALGTACNVARFHRLPSLLVLSNDSVNGWPAQAIACPNIEQSTAAGNRPQGVAWPADINQWQALANATNLQRVVTTQTEVAPDVSIERLLAVVQTL